MANEAFDKFKHDMTPENFAAAVAEAIAGEPEAAVVEEAAPEFGAEPAPEDSGKFTGSEI